MASKRLEEAFATVNTALIPYLTAGYPTLEGSREVLDSFLAAGADAVEIGVPFSDSLADGPVIQDTATRAIRNGTNLDHCLELAAYCSVRVPAIFFVSYNSIFSHWVERFLTEAAASGVSGLIVPDLSADEARRFRELVVGLGLKLCPMVAPTSTDERLDRVVSLATGFVYCVSAAGVTGARKVLPPTVIELLRRVKSRTSVPAALGFGIASPEAAAEVCGEADGVIIGSKLMKLVGDEGTEAAGAWLLRVRQALNDESIN
jgi:tryptophan synthase alpha chain